MASAYGARRQIGSEHVQQVGPMHALHAIPAVRVGSDNWPHDCPVGPVILRAVTDLRANCRQGFAQPHSFELPQTVRKKGSSRLRPRRALPPAKNRDVDPSSIQGTCGGKAANSSAHDSGAKAFVRLGFLIHSGFCCFVEMASCLHALDARLIRFRMTVPHCTATAGYPPFDAFSMVELLRGPDSGCDTGSYALSAGDKGNHPLSKPIPEQHVTVVTSVPAVLVQVG